MKFISSREFRIHPGGIWQSLEQGEDIVITSHGKPFGILLSTSGQDLQRLLNELLRLRARLAVSAMSENAQKAGLDRLSMSDVDAIIREVNEGKSGRIDESRNRH